jgi:hypothetical protein
MYGFVVRVREEYDNTGRLGSVVCMPYVLGLDLVVTVMWEDDLTFSVHGVQELQAVAPPEKDPEEKPEGGEVKIVNLFSTKKAATKH